MRRLKRSRVLHIGSLMATAGFTLAACDSPDVPAPRAEAEPALVYASLDECRTADVIPDAQCDAALAKAQEDAARTAPRFHEISSARSNPAGRAGTRSPSTRNSAGTVTGRPWYVHTSRGSCHPVSTGTENR